MKFHFQTIVPFLASNLSGLVSLYPGFMEQGNLNKVIEKLRVNSRERMHKDLTPIKLYTEKWLKEKGKIDSALNSFDHLIEKNDENQIFQVKNPYSDPSITGSDKEFLINWLKTVNNIRYPSTKGDHNSEAAKALIANGKWFNIPLITSSVKLRPSPLFSIFITTLTLCSL